jgi:hypothetical protein
VVADFEDDGADEDEDISIFDVTETVLLLLLRCQPSTPAAVRRAELVLPPQRRGRWNYCSCSTHKKKMLTLIISFGRLCLLGTK